MLVNAELNEEYYEISLRSQPTDEIQTSHRHIDNGEGKPLCGGNGREPSFWAPEEAEPA